jgi:hypothetical protein
VSFEQSNWLPEPFTAGKRGRVSHNRGFRLFDHSRGPLLMLGYTALFLPVRHHTATNSRCTWTAKRVMDVTSPVVTLMAVSVYVCSSLCSTPAMAYRYRQPGHHAAMVDGQSQPLGASEGTAGMLPTDQDQTWVRCAVHSAALPVYASWSPLATDSTRSS